MMRTNRQAWSLAGRTAIFAVLAAALWLAGRTASTGQAADRGDAPPKGTASELDLVPTDGVAMVSVHFADLWNHPALKAARAKIVKEAPEFQEQVAKGVGVALDEVERITGIMQSIEHRDWVGLVTTVKPYDSKKVLAAIAPDSTEEKVKDKTLHVNTRGPSIAFLTERTFVIGPADEVRLFLKHSGDAKQGPLTAALTEAAGKHLLVAGVDAEAFGKTAPPNPSGDEAAIVPVLKAEKVVLTVDLDDEVQGALRLSFAGEADAKAGEKAVNAGLDLARAALVKGLQEIGKQRDMAQVIALVEDLQAGLRAAKVERKDSDVVASLSVKIDVEKAALSLLPAVQKVRESAARMNSMNNLKQLALAMFNYHDVNGHFAPAAIADKNGKPLLSWRVAILPYIEQDALYKQFHLDEPWDSDNNKKLLEQMPPLYGFGDEKAAKNHETHYQGFVGKGAFFDGKKGVKITDITDGTSNTIMLVEAKETVPWSKPEDIPFDEGKLVPKVGGLSADVFNTAFCDGSVRSLPMTIKEETLRALITRNGGEVVDPSK